MASAGASPSFFFDVFLNFRGEDVRDNFVAHLHGALKQKGFNTFIDNRLKKGEEIGPELFKAIEGSRVSIVVFSQDYPSSSWCLNELLKIVECKENKKQKVLPVFYKVEPSHIRHQIYRVGEALAKHKEKFDDKKIDEWKKALKEVANLSGFHYKEGNEFEFIMNTIVQQVFQILQFPYLDVADYAVGIESRVEVFKKCLEAKKKKNAPCMVAIWGAAGIGKTTIAKAIYNSIAHDFEVRCFLANVRDCTIKDGSKALSKDGLTKLQNTILFKIFGDNSLKIDNVDEGKAKIQRILPSKKILLILDNVNQLEQLQTLAGNGDWFALNSVIIITTRDKSLYTSYKGNFEEHFLYEMKKLNHSEGLGLFNMYGIKTNELNDESLELAKEAVDYARGLPLTLTLLGPTLYGRNIDDRKEMLKECKRNSYEPIQTILKLSYDDLSEVLKAVFLDIACFFKGMDIRNVKEKLAGCGYCSPKLYIKELKDKSLIEFGQGLSLEMHDLIQEMGRQIVRLESVEAGGRSRLWFHEDVCHVLEENTGTNKVQGMVVDLPEGSEIELDPEAFKEMKNLKLLIVRNGRFSQVPNVLPNELRVLEWPSFPGESLPPKFRAKKLAVLKMPKSKLTDLKMNWEHLTTLHLGESEFQEVPSLSQAPNLVSIDLNYCRRLRKVDDSVGTLKKLFIFQAEGCHELKFFPRSLESRSLGYLNLRKCPLIGACPEIKSEKLRSLVLAETSIEELSLFGNYTELTCLDLCGCQKFKFLKLEDNKECGTSIDSTKVSEISSVAELLKLPTEPESSACNLDYSFPSKFALSETSFPQLRSLQLSGINTVSLPECIQYLVHLEMLLLRKCEQLKEISMLPINFRELQVNGCKTLQRIHFNADAFPKNFCIAERDCNRLSEGIWEDLRDLLVNAKRPKFNAGLHIQFSGREIPPWFSCFEPPGLTSRVFTGLPGLLFVVIKEPTLSKSEIKGIALCAVLGECRDPKSGETWEGALGSACKVSVTSLGSPVFMVDNDFESTECSKATILHCHISDSFEQNLKGKGINVEVSFDCIDCVIVKCGVHLIYGHEQNAIDQANIWRIDDKDEYNFEDCKDDSNGDDDDSNGDDDDSNDHYEVVVRIVPSRN